MENTSEWDHLAASYVKRVSAEWLTLGVYRIVPKNLKAYVRTDQLDAETERMVISLKGHILAMPGKRIEVHREWPKTWWDAVKLRFLPEWSRKYLPVEMDSVHVSEKQYGALCPHQYEDPSSSHFEFLYRESV